MKKDNYVLIGAGKGGHSILSVLLKISDINVKYVMDINPEAPGMVLANSNNISTYSNEYESILYNDNDIDVIFEVTGKEEVFNKIKSIIGLRCTLVGAKVAKVIFYLLNFQNQVTEKISIYKRNLENQLIERTEELEKTNQELHMEILKYEKLNQKLQQINNEKTKYLLKATHQLKAPFAAIQSYVDIVINGYTGEINEKTKNVMQKIQTRCEVLSTSIKEMLELANLKSCVKNNIKMENIKICQCLLSIIDASKIIAERKKINICFVNDEDNYLIKCNENQIKILFSILIDNAINYSFEDSQIDISIKKINEGKIAVSIKDKGIGIKEEHLSMIFNEYFRSNEATQKHENGSGLGLAIARQIANIHCFSIDIKSKINEGTTFIVSCPLT